MQAQSVIPQSGPYTAEMAGRPPKKNPPEFGKRLAELRKARGWTQSELAERLDTTVKMVTYFEREASNPTHKTLERIAEVFGISAAEVLGQNDGGKNGKPGPASRMEQLTARLAALPKSKQKVVADMLEGYLNQTSGGS